MMIVKRQLFSLFLVLFFPLFVVAQNMDRGFSLLETGKYEEATQFFEEILKKDPKNRTARICYGRAVGLGGNPKEATILFTELLVDYPNDYELKLNYAESILWNKSYDYAKPYYEGLIQTDPTSFPALLGYANTLSNLKEYPEAKTYVNKALAVSPGNPNALISKKYINLGYAYQLSQNQEYAAAMNLFDENLSLFPRDKETLLNKANLYLLTKEIEQAKAIYAHYGDTPKDKIVALNGTVLADHLAEKDPLALQEAITNLANATDEVQKKSIDQSLFEQTRTQFIQALIWNKKYKEANIEISKLEQVVPIANQTHALRATLTMYRSDYDQSIQSYQSLLLADSLSFDGNLGVSNAYFAANRFEEAYRSVDLSLVRFSKQKDALGLLEKMDLTFSPKVEEVFKYSFDNGNDHAYTSNTVFTLPIDLKWRLSAAYQFRNTRNTVSKLKATSHDMVFGAQYRVIPRMELKVTAGLTNTSGYSELINELSVNANLLRLQTLEVGYKRDVQNFNADLMVRKLVGNHLFLNHNIGSDFNVGWYTQYFYTWQNDKNRRNLLFTSLYYNLFQKPATKVGLNYQFIAFKDQLPTIYFSPSRFHAVEVFADLVKTEPGSQPKEFYYEVSGALGVQFIEQNSKQTTYRIQGEVGYKISNRMAASLFGLHSNIASVTASAGGFVYSEFGVKFKWVIGQPIFKRASNR